MGKGFMKKVGVVLSGVAVAGMLACTLSMSAPMTARAMVKVNEDGTYETVDGRLVEAVLDLEFALYKGRVCWFEGGIRQGTETDPKSFVYDGTIRGREIYDPATDAWYWLDANNYGAKAVSKEVFMPYTYQDEMPRDESDMLWDENTLNERTAACGTLANYVKDAVRNRTGKWVRYDANGQMIKGWYTNANGTYYYEPVTGAMVKGVVVIDGQLYAFDRVTGILDYELIEQ